ncbi:MAG: phosphatidylglycerophosphatase A [bacterium]
MSHRPADEGGKAPPLARAAATVFGIGYVPIAPGTAGSIVGVGIYWLLYQGGSVLPGVAFLFIAALAVWSAGLMERETGRKDPREVVLDEVAGQLLCLLGSPLTLADLGAAFVIFRILDIWKPFRRIESLPGGWGVVADDVAAGALGWAALALARFAGYL